MNKPVAWITPPKNVWTSCVACGQRVTGDSIHTCSPQLKELTDEEIEKLQTQYTEKGHFADTLNVKEFAKAILRKSQEK